MQNTAYREDYPLSTPIQEHINTCRDAGIEVIDPASQRLRLKDAYNDGWLNGALTAGVITLAASLVVIGIILAKVLV
jgi:hypothetical protein